MAGFEAATSGILEDVTIQGAREAVSLVTIGASFSVGEVDKWARMYSINHMGELVSGITETQKIALKGAFRQWQATGRNVDDFAERISGLFGQGRAEMIAVTEVTDAIAGGNISAWEFINRNSGRQIITGMQWVTANDEKVCPICAPLGGLTFEGEAQPAAIDQQLSGGQTTSLGGSFTHPGGNGEAAGFGGGQYRKPPAHPRCRCTLVPVLGSTGDTTGILERPPSDEDLPPAQAGESIFNFMSPPGKGKYAKRYRRTQEAIDNSHRVKPLRSHKLNVESYRNKRSTTRGQYQWYNYGDGRQIGSGIRMNTTGEAFEFTYAHEIGHWMDNMVLGEYGSFASQTGSIPEWASAMKGSDTYKKLMAMLDNPKAHIVMEEGKWGKYYHTPDKKYLKYLTSDKELFARSYAQYIAETSGDEVLLKQLKKHQEDWMYPVQWPEEDFAPIRKAFDDIFRRQGWSNP